MGKTTPRKRRPTFKIIIIILLIVAFIEFWILVDKPQEIPPIGEVKRVIENEKFPLILLYRGKPHGETIEWNTGVWPGWAEHKGNLKGREITQNLLWAAEGAKITKTCDVDCYVTHDQSLLPLSHAVIMEMVNHQKFFNRKLPVPWPPKKENQLWGIFHFEPVGWYKDLLEDPNVVNRFDFSITPRQSSTIPITLICEWGRSRGDYLKPIPYKSKFIADFNYHYDQNFYEFLNNLHRSLRLKIDTFYDYNWKNSDAPEPYSLPGRLSFISQFKFVIITEGISEIDWVCPEWSQAFLAGTVPIYLGAPNIEDFTPGPNSYINIRDYSSADELIDHLLYLDQNDHEYRKYFDWKKNGLSPSFQKHLDHCAHNAECRICKEVHKQFKSKP